ncbi:hypothetical protein [Paenibacillus thailandensis]|uniref:Uncharacterized protein n=1 Tax=Paenibacillus thailandensis TaxID=393250 RepID=A0ABW5QYF8_9BACL
MSATAVKIPHGDETVTLELTVKEMMALAGIRFHNDHPVEISARKKLQEAIEVKYSIDSKEEAPIPYQHLV